MAVIKEHKRQVKRVRDIYEERLNQGTVCSSGRRSK